jgi:hypothetical protein
MAPTTRTKGGNFNDKETLPRQNLQTMPKPSFLSSHRANRLQLLWLYLPPLCLLPSMGRMGEIPMTEIIGQWLERLSLSTSSNDQDSARMENLLHRLAMPKARVVLGICYLEGSGSPCSIHTIAAMLVKKAKEGKCQQSMP